MIYSFTRNSITYVKTKVESNAAPKESIINPDRSVHDRAPAVHSDPKTTRRTPDKTHIAIKESRSTS